MFPAEYLFWSCITLVIYTYILYPVLLFLVYSLEQVRRDCHYLTTRRDRRRSYLNAAELPGVSLLVPAYNEQVHLKEKITNVQQVDYPSDRLEAIFVSDGSTDRTNEILRTVAGSNIHVFFFPIRRGKLPALNHAMAQARHHILILSDASTLLAPDAVRKLVRHFADPAVGVVCGALRFDGTSEFHQTEGIYWKYESMLRLMEARLGATLTASGAIYALRRECYPQLPLDCLIEDFVIPMNARKQGYQVLYDPEAVATDFAASSVAGEFTRRVRLALGSFLALRALARIPLGPVTSLAFLSHKVLRWFLPFVLIGLLASNAALWDSPLYRIALIGQLVFYLWAAVGCVFRRHARGIRYALMGYYLLAMHLAYFVGFLQFLRGRREATWHRVS